MYFVTEEISCIYGIAILMCFIFIILEIILDTYLMGLLNSEIKLPNRAEVYKHAVESVFWMLPISIFLIVGCICSNVTKEVKFIKKNI